MIKVSPQTSNVPPGIPSLPLLLLETTQPKYKHTLKKNISNNSSASDMVKYIFARHFHQCEDNKCGGGKKRNHCGVYFQQSLVVTGFATNYPSEANQTPTCVPDMLHPLLPPSSESFIQRLRAFRQSHSVMSRFLLTERPSLPSFLIILHLLLALVLFSIDCHPHPLLPGIRFFGVPLLWNTRRMPTSPSGG